MKSKAETWQSQFYLAGALSVQVSVGGMDNESHLPPLHHPNSGRGTCEVISIKASRELPTLEARVCDLGHTQHSVFFLKKYPGMRIHPSLTTIEMSALEIREMIQ